MMMKIFLPFKWSWHNPRCCLSISGMVVDKTFQPWKDYGTRITHKDKELSPFDKNFPSLRRSLIILLHYCTGKQLKRIIN